MKVILQQDVKKLGKKGDIVEVSEGYGRNFLLPRKAAVPATAQNMNVAKAQAGSKARKDAMAADEAKLMAAQLEKVSVTIPVRIGEGGKLFGSVTTKEISAALKEQFGLELDSKKLVLPDAIKSFGSYQVKAKLGYEISGNVNVLVVEG